MQKNYEEYYIRKKSSIKIGTEIIKEITQSNI
jgi:hypothetical protein